MKKVIVIAILMSASFMGGIFWEHRATISDYSEWQQIAQEACDVRIKTLKFSVKNKENNNEKERINITRHI